MKPSLSEDLTSIAAIAVGATITIGLSAALLLRESAVPTARPVAVPVMRIPDGYRAVTVPVSAAAAAGTRVDIVVTLNDARGIAQMVLQNIPVLRHPAPNFVTLLVTPAEAERLATAEATGALHLAVRGEASTSDMPVRESGLLRRSR